jgi:predicted ATP-dependent endonuclease of OLD family
MRLIRARVRNYRSVEDSEESEIRDLTCLVGKNEAGKTALLNALRGLRSTTNFSYDETRDYPRRFATRFDERHPDGNAEVVRTWWQVEDEDRCAVEQRFGQGVQQSSVIEVHYGFRYGEDKRLWDIAVDDLRCLQNLISKHGLDAAEQNALNSCVNAASASKTLSSLSEQSPRQEALLQDINKCRNTSFQHGVLDVLEVRQPKFFYTSHFERKLMPTKVSEFSHYAPAEWLMRNPTALDGESPDVTETLARAERVFATYNALIK